MQKTFDLNIDTILGQWTKPLAIREIIANGLDEHKLIGLKKDIIIKHNSKNNTLIICDEGRGIEPKHLIQNENKEKNSAQGVIGKFGMGLKDAIATLYRNGSVVRIITPVSQIMFDMIAKHNFGDIMTLHAVIGPNPSPNFNKGTIFEITSITEEDVVEAKRQFLVYSGLKLIESNNWGEVYEKDVIDDEGIIFINGMKISAEPTFKYCYNITNLTAKVRQGLNRDRMHVGRQVWSDSVIKVILKSESARLIDELVVEFIEGIVHDDLRYMAVQEFIVGKMIGGKYMFGLVRHLGDRKVMDIAKKDGLCFVVVSDKLYQKLKGMGNGVRLVDGVGEELGGGSKKVRKFDLNINSFLDHWDKSLAIRELISNALDEHVLNGLGADKDIEVKYDRDTRILSIRDFGRGIKPEHLIQSASKEKTESSKVIGKFGVGLKDAIATLYKNGCDVVIESKWGRVSVEMMGKADFEEIQTLHAVIEEPLLSGMVGSVILVKNINASDVDEAKENFVKYNGAVLVESTGLGCVYLAGNSGNKSRKKDVPDAIIYVNGMKISSEPNFKFSYDVTNLNGKISSALNRERMNVGRSAYKDRVVGILLECTNKKMINEMVGEYMRGKMYDEYEYKEVQEFLVRHDVIQNVIYLTQADLERNPERLDLINKSGKIVKIVSSEMMNKLSTMKNADGKSIMTINKFMTESNEAKYKAIDIGKLSGEELETFGMIDRILKMCGFERILPVVISEKITLGDMVCDGLCANSEIVISRYLLRKENFKGFCGTLVHEFVHLYKGHRDVSREFECDLTNMIGNLTANNLPSFVAAMS